MPAVAGAGAASDELNLGSEVDMEELARQMQINVDVYDDLDNIIWFDSGFYSGPGAGDVVVSSFQEHVASQVLFRVWEKVLGCGSGDCVAPGGRVQAQRGDCAGDNKADKDRARCLVKGKKAVNECVVPLPAK